jgi:hypothetical protein
MEHRINKETLYTLRWREPRHVASHYISLDLFDSSDLRKVWLIILKFQEPNSEDIV